MVGNTRVVGVTGRSGSGKSSVAGYYASLGYPVADGDLIAREIAQPGSEALQQLAEAFGEDIIAPDGSLLRRELAQRAFASPQQNARLMAITHPHITRRILEKAKEASQRGATLFFVDGAMIVGQMVAQHCDDIVVVTAPYTQAAERVMARDGISAAALDARLAAQLTEEELTAAADYVIENDDTLAALYAKAEVVLRSLLRKEG